jgi:hypothetical protein
VRLLFSIKMAEPQLTHRIDHATYESQLRCVNATTIAMLWTVLNRQFSFTKEIGRVENTSPQLHVIVIYSCILLSKASQSLRNPMESMMFAGIQ